MNKILEKEQDLIFKIISDNYMLSLNNEETDYYSQFFNFYKKNVRFILTFNSDLSSTIRIKSMKYDDILISKALKDFAELKEFLRSDLINQLIAFINKLNDKFDVLNLKSNFKNDRYSLERKMNINKEYYLLNVFELDLKIESDYYFTLFNELIEELLNTSLKKAFLEVLKNERDIELKYNYSKTNLTQFKTTFEKYSLELEVKRGVNKLIFENRKIKIEKEFDLIDELKLFLRSNEYCEVVKLLELDNYTEIEQEEFDCLLFTVRKMYINNVFIKNKIQTDTRLKITTEKYYEEINELLSIYDF